MRTFKFLSFLLACMSMCAISTLVAAEEKAKPNAEPPKLEKIDDTVEPTVTIAPSKSKNSVTETRRQGKVVEVKVKSGKSTYYLKPNTPVGSALPGDAQTNTVRAPQWKLMEFDLGHKKKTEVDDVPDAAPVLPPAVEPASAPPK